VEISDLVDTPYFLLMAGKSSLTVVAIDVDYDYRMALSVRVNRERSGRIASIEFVCTLRL
jgi:hypothetical protein